MARRRVTTKNNRAQIIQRIRQAHNNKPTATGRRRGMTPEEIQRLFGKEPPKRRIINRAGGVKRENRASFTSLKMGTVSEKTDLRHFSVPEWFLNDKQVDVSIIVPMYKSKNVIKKQIETWESDPGLGVEIIYMDDCCPENSCNQALTSWAEKKPQHKIGNILRHTKNHGFAAACNKGAAAAKGKYLIFLNADCFVKPGWIKPMIDRLESDPTIGIVGNLQLRESGAIDSAGSQYNKKTGWFEHVGKHVYGGKALDRPFTQETAPAELLTAGPREMVTGACFAIRKSLFDELKFDTGYRTGYWEDSDLNMRVQAMGYKVYFEPASVIIHKGGHSNAGAHPYALANRNRFHKKWVESGLIKAFVSPDRDVVVTPNSSVIYTAISKGYDKLKEQPKIEGAEFVAFLEEDAQSKTWKYQPLHREFKDTNRNAKIHKILPHIYFPNKEYSLWIDGSVDIEFGFPIENLIRAYLWNADLAIFRHPYRNCIYNEANICIQRRLDSPDIIRKQIARYSKEKYPQNIGLVEATVMLRRHTPEMKAFCEAWWEEIQNGSKRDQISFNYVARKMRLKYNHFPADLRTTNYLFKVHKHNS